MFWKRHKIDLSKEELVSLLIFLGYDSESVFNEITDELNQIPEHSSEIIGGKYYVEPCCDGITFHIKILFNLFSVTYYPDERITSSTQIYSLSKNIKY